MRLQPRAFGPPSQSWKDPSHNRLNQPHHHLEWIWNFLKYLSWSKTLVAPNLFADFGKPVNDVFIRHHFINWIADTNFKFISCLEMLTLLRTLDQLMFWNYIAHKKERLVFVVCLFLNDTSFKTLKGRNLYRIIFPNLVFMLYHKNYIKLLHEGIVFPSSAGQIFNPCS